MELKDLIGLHELTAVDFETKSIKQYGDIYEDCQVLNFTLDGITYSAVEDPDDGYRSCMEDIFISYTTLKNTFPACKVMGIMQEDDSWEKNDVLDLVDVVTGKPIVSVGTANIDDYYPYFVAKYNPENMATNQQED